MLSMGSYSGEAIYYSKNNVYLSFVLINLILSIVSHSVPACFLKANPINGQTQGLYSR